MVKYIYMLMSMLLAVVFATACSKEEDTSGTSVLEAPSLVSSTPEDGATDIPVGNLDIVLTFDQNVTSPSANHSLVTVEGAEVTDISADLETVVVSVSGLQEDKDYCLVIPEGVILGPTKVSAKEIRLNFSTVESIQTEPVASTLCTPNPLQQAQNVYDFLVENYGQKIVSGVMANVNWNTNEAEWVYQHTGKYPALNCFDYIHLYASPANWIDYSDISVAEDWWNRNGLVAANWHWNVPKSENASATDVTYDPEQTDFRPLQALQEGTWQHEVLNADLEEIAGYLKLLQEKNIPVIWRPLHEAAGNIYEYAGGKAWFWWGADGADAYRQLWIYMFDFFRDKGVNNLIWVWTSQTGDEDFYPGDNYVDIIGRDIYNVSGASAIYEEYTTLVKSYPDKLITLSECGSVSEIGDQWAAGAKWSWFMPWYDYTRTNDVSSSEFQSSEHEHASAAWWQNAVEADVVITLDEMPSLK